jgi:hypothetical protein
MIPGLHGVLVSAKYFKSLPNLHELFVDSRFNNEELTVVCKPST